MIESREQGQTIRITESEIRDMVRESVERILSESKSEYGPNGYRIVKGGMDYTIKGKKQHSKISVVNKYGTAYHIVEDDHCYTFYVSREGKDTHQYQYPYIFDELYEAFKLLPPPLS